VPKKQKADARIEDIRDKFLERAAEMWDVHEDEFMKVLEDSESKRVNLTFKAELDFSESTAKLKSVMSFSQVMTDRKEDDFEDPNQQRLPGLGKDGKEKKGRKNQEPETTPA